MYSSLALILASLPFLTAAVPLADPFASRGIAVPIAKRSNPSNGVADTSELLTNIRRSVAKIQTGFTAYEINTGVAHPLSRSIKLSRRGSGGDPLTDDEAQALLWYGTISVGTPAVSRGISAASFNLGPISQGSSTCLAGAFANPSLTSKFWILGDVFLQNVYTAWDVGNARIGFATLA